MSRSLKGADNVKEGGKKEKGSTIGQCTMANRIESENTRRTVRSTSLLYYYGVCVALSYWLIVIYCKVRFFSTTTLVRGFISSKLSVYFVFNNRVVAPLA